MTGEAGHDDLAACLGEGAVERGADGGLGLDEAGHLRVRGIGHQQVHTLFAELAELHQNGDLVVERQLVEFDVAGVDKAAGRVLTNTASASGIECVTVTNSRLNGPTLSLSRPWTTVITG